MLMMRFIGHSTIEITYSQIYKYLLQSTFDFPQAQVNGSTGIIEFEKTGARKVHKLEILNLRDNVFFKV